jgi:hypothetical protein
MELKPKMTFEEMSRHMEENTYRFTNRVNVGRYARDLGYKVYKPMVCGKVLFFYINENIHPKNNEE